MASRRFRVQLKTTEGRGATDCEVDVVVNADRACESFLLSDEARGCFMPKTVRSGREATLWDARPADAETPIGAV